MMDDARHNEWRMDFSWRGTPLKSLHCLIASSLQGSSLRQFPHHELITTFCWTNQMWSSNVLDKS